MRSYLRIFILFFSLPLFTFYCQDISAKQVEKDLMFRQLSTDEGLPQETILALIKDSRGVIWVGTQNGLAWFDGYQFQPLNNNADDQNSLSGNFVWSIAEDSEGYIWVGTKSGGLNKYDPQTRSFTHYLFDPENPESIGSNNVTALLVDSRNRLWIGTAGAGLYRYNPEQNNFTAFKHNANDSKSIASDFIATIEEDEEGNLWLGHGYMFTRQTQAGGITQFSPQKGALKIFAHSPDDSNSIASNRVYSLLIEKDAIWAGTYSKGLNRIDRANGLVKRFPISYPQYPEANLGIVFDILRSDKNHIWVSALSGGLYSFNEKTEEIVLLENASDNPFSIANINVTKLLLDENNLWVGTWWEGLQKHLISSQAFHWARPHGEDWKLNVNLRSITSANENEIWIAAETQGLFVWDREKNTFSRFTPKMNLEIEWKDVSVFSTHFDSSGYLWIGTSNNGLFRLNTKNGEFQHYNQIPNADINSIIEYPKGTLWLGLRGLGVYRMEIESGKTRLYQSNQTDASTLISNNISTNGLTFDRRGFLWIATHEGLSRLSPATGEVMRFSKNDSNNSLKASSVTGVATDSKGNLWITTYGGGLTRATPSENGYSFKHFNSPKHLPGNNIDSLVVDKMDNLWLTVSGKIVNFNTTQNKSFIYDKFDGAMPGDFLSGARHVTAEGTIMFYGMMGINYFTPEDVSIQSNSSAPLLSNLQVYNSARENGEVQAVQNQHIEHGSIVSLKHTQKMFAVEFTSLDYVNPDNNTFAYRMLGFNDQWVLASSKRRIATYTGLPAGDYKFEVKFANKFGIWNEQIASMEIKVLPAPWRTWWAYTLYVLFFILTLGSFAWQRHKVALANQQKRLAEAENDAKSAFLATMSHEIRTPINGVIGSVSLLSESQLNEEQRSYAKAIKVSGENLLYIVNDILDLSKIEAGELTLENHQFNLRTCIEYALDVFSNEVSKKSLELLLVADDDIPMEVISDSTRLRQIIVNLVGNAIKFTEYGEVTVFLKHCGAEDNNHRVQFCIKDTGEGIPEEKQSRVFEAFKQADNSIARTHGGTGLGLSISQHLVSKLGGNIEVSSQVGEGTEFYFTISLEAAGDFISINHLACAPHFSEKSIVFVNLQESQRQLFSLFERSFDSDVYYLDTVSDLRTTNLESLDFIIFNKNNLSTSDLTELESIKSTLGKRVKNWLLFTAPQSAHRHIDEIEKLFDSFILKPLKLRTIVKKLDSLLSEASETNTEYTKQDNRDFAQHHPLEVLLAEDNAVNQKILLHTFRNLGYEPDMVSNGYEILSACKAKQYDILIADMHMPGMDGLSASKILRKDNLDIQILICSAEDESIFEKELNANLIQGILKKNVTTSLIKPWLRRCFKACEVE